MGDITVLPDSLIDKIAAGEVVESPASVVKELLENSIDARATAITITIADGGKSLIKIQDNGTGMNKEDALLSIKRHATSKVRTENDLFAIASLGFRGEALASICAVSRFTLMTRQQDTISGTRVKVDSGGIIEEACGCEKGTLVVIEDLFYNVPARKKFLKGTDTEYNRIIDVVTRYALAYPHIQFRLTHNDKPVILTPGSGDGLQTIHAIYGQAQHMLPIAYKDEIVTINGFIAKPEASRGDKNRQTLFVNGRFIKSRELAEAIKQGYHSMLFLEREPVYILHLQLDERKVDVNVHPRKEVVKISMMPQICEHVTYAVKEVLKDAQLVVEADASGGSTAQARQHYRIEPGQQMTLAEHDTDKTHQYQPALQEKETSSESSRIGPIRVLGQLNRMYIVAESAQGLMLIDQHAAEERINYELLMKQLHDDAVRKQKLLKPLQLEVSPSEMHRIMQLKEALSNCGYELEEYGKNTLLIRSVPFIFERPSKSLIEELVDSLQSGSETQVMKEAEERIIRFSCRKSIKAGDVLHISQMEQLMRKLDACELPFTCPHGRPTIISLGLKDIEKKFKRA